MCWTSRNAFRARSRLRCPGTDLGRRELAGGSRATEETERCGWRCRPAWRAGGRDLASDHPPLALRSRGEGAVREVSDGAANRANGRRSPEDLTRRVRRVVDMMFAGPLRRQNLLIFPADPLWFLAISPIREISLCVCSAMIASLHASKVLDRPNRTRTCVTPPTRRRHRLIPA